MALHFSFIVPVYNRPEETKELLESFLIQDSPDFEVVIVEDGSQHTSEEVIDDFARKLNVSYYQKPNTGPGDSRNYGMRRAKGDYFIILDSDCVLPPHYLTEVRKELDNSFVHCFGGPDQAHESFTSIQKAIDFTMTAFITTGGIRGGKKAVTKFQPRSFNLGISKEAFVKTGGFGNIHPGEDPDLVFRLWKSGYDTRLFKNAFVYHKRRINWKKFRQQVTKFGMVRAILNKWHPKTAKIAYWFPSFITIGFLSSLLLAAFGIYWPSLCVLAYVFLVFLGALIAGLSFKAAFLSIYAVAIQFFGYGLGFLKSTILVNFSNKKPEELFPTLFFKA
ncbi:MAG: glycosyltransferase [Allomuricauda sp.]|nr:MAG: glycosyltransferase [Allomuricauda sp.]